ncbi:L-glutamate gamma-semialdehyde dehydrogenase [Capsulimonas corticalis]|uniref:L-glutamate gamma-semialdehyde dehydrogenase n=1 Tax=Capsulimonas corticalis TaxID=2219043 RepID=A0A402D4P5_9BACT|nr:proline dehydrogenase family protein [Capsulimonas corticalis]BDI29310.1 L-glutamate gamma-semialdehyde dehydrogenase [Capsulimonas corticalis]
MLDHAPAAPRAISPFAGDSSVERRTQELGKKLLMDLQRQERGGGLQDRLYGAMMGIAMGGGDATKTEMFRFVDVLPALKTPEAVTTHLNEYLLKPAVTLPAGASSVLRFGGRSAFTRRLMSAAVQQGTRMMARRFIAGADAQEALGVVEGLRRQNLAFTMDLLGEAVTSEAESLAYQKKYLTLLTDLAKLTARWPARPILEAAPFGGVPRVNVSVKLSALYARFDPMAAEATSEAVKERLRPILTLARKTGAFVNVDMEQHDFRGITQRIFQEILCEDEYKDWPDVGIVVQAYLTRSSEDLVALRDWAEQRGTPVWVRLVKGAYWDYETIIAAQRGHGIPVYQNKPETDANYERCAAFLIENWRTLRPAIASHNVRSASHALALAEAVKAPKGAVEFQVLYGMGESLGRALVAQGQRVRVYVPFGELLPGMAYLVRRLLENTSNDSFVKKLSDHADVAALLAPPSAVVTPARPVLTLSNSSQTFVNDPETDFAVPENQERMQKALIAVRSELGLTVPIVIGGKRESSEETIDRADPSDTSRIASRMSCATRDQTERALVSAAAAFPAWRDTPPSERGALLRRTAQELEKRRFKIAAWQVYEVGKPWREADADIAEAIDFCVYYADEMERMTAPRRRDIPGEWNSYIYDGRGPAVIIAPWNFPLAILTGMAVAALVTGNPVILKPAEQSSRVGYFLMEALEAAGVPAGVANFLPGVGETIGPVLVSDPRVALIAFTGSKDVGLSIIKAAAETPPGQREIKRVIAELGGKNAIIIDEDADLDEAVLGVLASTTGFSGQKCSACSRVIVVGSAWEAFQSRLAEAVKSIRIGPAEDPATTMGPVVDEASRERVQKYIAIGKTEARLLAQANVPAHLEDAGNYVPAAVFYDCQPEGRLCREEIFGPVLAVLRAPNLDEALTMASDSPYALSGGFYSRSPANIERIRREFRVGNLYINRKITGALVDRQPFGGAAMSGVGSKAGGPDYLLQFVVPRTITESVMRRGFAPEAG